MFCRFLTIVFCFAFMFSIAAQNKNQDNDKLNAWNKEVRVSPRAFVIQTVGTADVTISYSRPGVKGRQIWGGLVPYDKVWRAGANEATKITFGKDVLINGKKLAAGSYAFFTIPSKDEWTVIFNKTADQWGAFEYNQAEDALRIKVKPQSAEFNEWLEYTFSDMKINKKGNNSAVINLNWDKLKIPFTVEFQ